MRGLLPRNMRNVEQRLLPHTAQPSVMLTYDLAHQQASTALSTHPALPKVIFARHPRNQISHFMRLVL